MSDLDLIIQLTGGLGNQLFQYALARRLQIERTARVRFDLSLFDEHNERAINVRKYRTHLTEVSAMDRLAIRLSFGRTLSKAAAVLKPIARPVLFERFFDAHQGCDPRILQLTGRWYLSGWWQSPEYFDSIRSILLQEFQPADPLNETDAELRKKIENSNAVCVHIRRGDYVTDPKYNKEFKAQSAAYYHDCMRELQIRLNHPKFFLFTDDPAWAKQNITGDVTHVDHHDGNSDYIDLHLMSRCRHFITANSTFSWWAAWLSPYKRKTVIVPKVWRLPAQGPPADLVPADWQIGPMISTEDGLTTQARRHGEELEPQMHTDAHR
jgi:hypothetical protein